MADRGRQYLLLADEDLISLVAQGDAEALAVLYDRHSRAVYSLAYRMMGERQAAEDLALDAGEDRSFGAKSPAERGVCPELAQLATRAGTRGPEHPPQGAAEDPRARVLLRIHARGDRRAARSTVGTVKGRMRLGLKKIGDYFDAQDMVMPR